MKKILYLGLDPSNFIAEAPVIHYPIIRLIPRSKEEVLQICPSLHLYSHYIFTSKNSVKLFFSCFQDLYGGNLALASILRGKCLSIGPATSKALKGEGNVEPILESSVCTQEGLIVLFSALTIANQKLERVLYPRSSLARPLLRDHLEKASVEVTVIDLYDTIWQRPFPLPSFDEIGEIVFTSPSVVEGFFQIFTSLPPGKKITFQGPITKKAFEEKLTEIKQKAYDGCNNNVLRGEYK